MNTDDPAPRRTDRIGKLEAELKRLRAMQKAAMPPAVEISPDVARELLHENHLLRAENGVMSAEIAGLRENASLDLAHRARNLVGVVQAISRATLSRSLSLAEFDDKFSGRLGALSRAQGLLARADAKPITIAGIVSGELAAVQAKPGAVSLSGPDAPLGASLIQTMVLAVHELAINSIAHGALKWPEGRVAVDWSCRTDRDARRLTMRWVEDGAPAACVPLDARRRGYGLQLIEDGLPYQLGATTRCWMGERGLHCEIDLPV